jgi:hypothetical protein
MPYPHGQVGPLRTHVEPLPFDPLPTSREQAELVRRGWKPPEPKTPVACMFVKKGAG